MKGTHVALILFGSAFASAITGSLIGGPGRSGESWGDAIFVGLFVLYIFVGLGIDKFKRKK